MPVRCYSLARWPSREGSRWIGRRRVQRLTICSPARASRRFVKTRDSCLPERSCLGNLSSTLCVFVEHESESGHGDDRRPHRFRLFCLFTRSFLALVLMAVLPLAATLRWSAFGSSAISAKRSRRPSLNGARPTLATVLEEADKLRADSWLRATAGEVAPQSATRTRIGIDSPTIASRLCDLRASSVLLSIGPGYSFSPGRLNFFSRRKTMPSLRAKTGLCSTPSGP
jgi:hypothetical protein